MFLGWCKRRCRRLDLYLDKKKSISSESSPSSSRVLKERGGDNRTAMAFLMTD